MVWDLCGEWGVRCGVLCPKQEHKEGRWNQQQASPITWKKRRQQCCLFIFIFGFPFVCFSFLELVCLKLLYLLFCVLHTPHVSNVFLQT